MSALMWSPHHRWPPIVASARNLDLKPVENKICVSPLHGLRAADAVRRVLQSTGASRGGRKKEIVVGTKTGFTGDQDGGAWWKNTHGEGGLSRQGTSSQYQNSNFDLCRVILHLVMSCIGFVLTIQIERRQCCLEAYLSFRVNIFWHSSWNVLSLNSRFNVMREKNEIFFASYWALVLEGEIQQKLEICWTTCCSWLIVFKLNKNLSVDMIDGWTEV